MSPAAFAAALLSTERTDAIALLFTNVPGPGTLEQLDLGPHARRSRALANAADRLEQAGWDVHLGTRDDGTLVLSATRPVDSVDDALDRVAALELDDSLTLDLRYS